VTAFSVFDFDKVGILILEFKIRNFYVVFCTYFQEHFNNYS
jgi:hypothetical protein